MILTFRIICTLWALHFYTFSNPNDYGVLQKCSIAQNLEISTYSAQDNIGIIEYSTKRPTPQMIQGLLSCLQKGLPSTQDFIYKDKKLLIELNVSSNKVDSYIRTTRSRIISSKLEVTGTCSINGAQIKIKTENSIFQTKCHQNKWYYLSKKLSKKPNFLIITQLSTKGKKNIDLVRL